MRAAVFLYNYLVLWFISSCMKYETLVFVCAKRNGPDPSLDHTLVVNIPTQLSSSLFICVFLLSHFKCEVFFAHDAVCSMVTVGPMTRWPSLGFILVIDIIIRPSSLSLIYSCLGDSFCTSVQTLSSTLLFCSWLITLYPAWVQIISDQISIS
jgi:hypothetical protein